MTDFAPALRPAGSPSSGEGRDVPAARRRELSDFLRSRRARLSPDDVGMVAGRRRRTPGLRREEVAELASVGVTWYTWLEQGRAIRPSADVVDSIAGALRLDATETDHLHALAGTQSYRHVELSRCVTPQLRAVLTALEPCPAAVTNERYDVLAWNRAEAALMGDFAGLPEADRNFLWLAFTNPAWQRLFLDYDDTVRRMVARFRSNMSHHVGEPAWSALVDRLHRASPLFAEVWQRHEISGVTTRRKRYLHPLVGLLSLDHTILRLADTPDAELRVYTPADDESRAAMERLLAG